jgi:hypothetical protein
MVIENSKLLTKTFSNSLIDSVCARAVPLMGIWKNLGYASSINLLILSISLSTVFGGVNDKFENQYFSINIPKTWTYIEYSSTTEAAKTGFGPGNEIWLTPNQFSDFLLIDDVKEIIKKLPEGGALAGFFQDGQYRIKNSPLESYVKHVIDKYGIFNITSQQYTTVGKEKSVSLHANHSAGLDNINIALYAIIYDNEPYAMVYMANTEYYEKYLSDFEQMVKSFGFVSGSSEVGELVNENISNIETNFSGANLTDFNSKGTADGNYPEELFDECVRVAGKDFCDFLFKR